MAVGDLSPLANVLEGAQVMKVIHNASFERSVLRKVNLSIGNIFDTLTTSR